MFGKTVNLDIRCSNTSTVCKVHSKEQLAHLIVDAGIVLQTRNTIFSPQEHHKSHQTLSQRRLKENFENLTNLTRVRKAKNQDRDRCIVLIQHCGASIKFQHATLLYCSAHILSFAQGTNSSEFYHLPQIYRFSTIFYFDLPEYIFAQSTVVGNSPHSVLSMDIETCLPTTENTETKYMPHLHLPCFLQKILEP